ncbi:MAG: hypothetical protein M0R41_01645 [Methylobacter tundripaludum]|nr:hypothetical protein [Methylobacter tundripaludum]
MGTQSWKLQLPDSRSWSFANWVPKPELGNQRKAAVAVKFARALVEHKGEVTNAELQAMSDAGFSEADIVEVITHVGMNIMTNILGKASRVSIDFPKVALKQAA